MLHYAFIVNAHLSLHSFRSSARGSFSRKSGRTSFTPYVHSVIYRSVLRKTGNRFHEKRRVSPPAKTSCCDGDGDADSDSHGFDGSSLMDSSDETGAAEASGTSNETSSENLAAAELAGAATGASDAADALASSDSSSTPSASDSVEISNSQESASLISQTGTKASEQSEEANATSRPNRFINLLQAIWETLKKWLAPPAFIVGLVAGITLSIVFIISPGPLGTRDALLREKVTLFDVILHDISESYVDKVDINRLFETGVNSMLGTLDPYTQFENNAQALEMSVKTNGRYAGVGLGLSLGDPDSSEQDERPIIVVSAFEGYAFDAGVRPGDIIYSVSGNPVSGVSLEQVTEMLRGEPGTEVDISVSREGFSKPLSFTLSRKSVHIKDVPAATFIGDGNDGVAYIRLQSFAKDAASEVSDAFKGLVASKRSISSVVVDLRGNPGGLLNAAIEVAELFVPNGSTIVSTKGRGLGPSPLYKSSQEPLLKKGTPLAVLVNGQTASASEIVAGAVQDLDLGLVVGSRTFGKGLVQNVQELPFNTALKYTVGKYYTPSGRCIQALNYEQGQENRAFEAKQVEESQRKEFRTVSGRTVRDGGGIEPDVDVQKRPSYLELALQRQNMYFRFANRFSADAKLDKLPKNFTMTDGIYKDFVKFVSQSNFKYESRFDEAFDQLNEMFKDVGYETARGKIQDLKKVTNAEMRSDFLRHDRDIRIQVESAIRYRLQPDSERIVAELKNDDQLAEAIRVLKSRKEYMKLLMPGLKDVAAKG